MALRCGAVRCAAAGARSLHLVVRDVAARAARVEAGVAEDGAASDEVFAQHAHRGDGVARDTAVGRLGWAGVGLSRGFWPPQLLVTTAGRGGSSSRVRFRQKRCSGRDEISCESRVTTGFPR